MCGWWRTPLGGNTGGNGATVSKLPLERTDAPGIYRRGSRYVVVYRVGYGTEGHRFESCRARYTIPVL